MGNPQSVVPGPDGRLSAPDVDSAQFRQLLGRFATGVVVITARDRSGRPAGMTANSLASVSLNPPLVSICVEQAADMHRVLSENEEFVINILASQQEALSRRFAGHEPMDRFDGIGYQLNPGGLVILEGILAHIECARLVVYPLGDHSVFVCRVTGGAAHDGRPLLYYRGGYTGMEQG